MFHALLKAPVFADTAATRQAKILYRILWLVLSFTVLALLILSDSTIDSLRTPAVIVLITMPVLFALLYKGKLPLAKYGLITLLWLPTTWFAWVSPHFYHPALAIYVALLLICGLLVMPRTVLIVSGLDTLVLLALFARAQNRLPDDVIAWPHEWLLWVLLLIFIGLLVYLSGEPLEHAANENRESRQRQEAGSPPPGGAVPGAAMGRTQTGQAGPENIAYFRSLAENLPDAVFIVDIPEMRLVYTNRAAFLGYDTRQPDFVQTIRAAIHPDDRPLLREQWRQLKRSADETLDTAADNAIEHRIRHTTGEWHWMATRSVALERDAGSQITRILYVTTSLTRHKQAEHALRDSEEKLRLIFDNSPDVILILDEATSLIQSVSPAITSVLGYLPEELVNQPIERIIADDGDEWVISETGGSPLEHETLPFKRKDGSICLMEMTAASITWETRDAVLYNLRDVTERETIRSERIAMLTLRQEIERQQSAIQVQEHFIAVISHQLRNPLSVISMMADILRHYDNRLTAAQRRERLDKILLQVERMTAMSDDLLMIRQGMLGALECRPEIVELDAFCQGLDELVSASGSNTHHYVYINRSGVQRAWLDTRLLRRILENLITNAVKYSPSGGEIRLQIDREDTRLVFRVSDQGIGIPAAARKNLFQLFYRAPNVSHLKGTGLGLVIVRDSVQAHGGSIQVESEEGRGTTFIVRLPLESVALRLTPAGQAAEEAR